MQKMLSLFVFLFSLPSWATLPSSTANIAEHAPWVDYPAEYNVKEKVKATLIDSLGMSQDADFSLARVFSSNWYLVSLDDSQFVVDATAKHWMSYDGNEIFLFQGGISKVNVSNGDREDLMALGGFVLSSKEDYIVYPAYGDATDRWVIAFMDPLCPYCRRFHMTQMGKLRQEGVGFVYVPFLRNPTDKKGASVWRGVFCDPSALRRTELMDDVFLRSPKQAKSHYSGITSCPTPTRNALLNALLKSAALYPIGGSPMFLTEEGRVHYGADALQQGL
jgi:hypothetical protein